MFRPVVLLLAFGCAETTETDAGVVDTGTVVDAGTQDAFVLPDVGVRRYEPCTDDESCGAPDLYCNRSVPAGMCQSPDSFCMDDADQSVEAQQCGGPDFTCLANTEGGAGECTLGCRSRIGDCPEGRICTTFWLNRENESPGCWPFCTSDDHCGPGLGCDKRVGACVQERASMRDGLQDGEPCAPTSNEFGQSDVCRGACVVINPPDEGLCASIIHRVLQPECPDDPSTMAPFGRAVDDLGLCVFRQCTSNTDCTSPLRCGQCGGYLCCNYP